MKTLKAYDILPNLLQAINTMYPGTRAKVVSPDGNRKQSVGESRNLVSCLPRRLRRHPAVVLADLDYADDISLLFDNLEQAQELPNRIELECTKVGLWPNIKETEVITYNFSPEHLPMTTAGGTTLKEVHGSTQLSKI